MGLNIAINHIFLEYSIHLINNLKKWVWIYMTETRKEDVFSISLFFFRFFLNEFVFHQ